jgi:hypothetical protein
MTARFKRDERRKVKVTDTTMEILVAVHEARYMTKDLLYRLIWDSKESKHSYCKTKLRGMYENKHLDKRHTPANSPDVYYTGLQGRRLLAKAFGFEIDWLRRINGIPGDTETPNLQVRHDLTLSRLYVDARLECTSRGWEMEWKNGRILEVERLGVQPDGWIRVSRGEKAFAAYIEFTNQITTKEEVRRKVEAYGIQAVLWFTTSQAKAKTIRECGALAVAEIESNWLTRPVWWVGGKQESWIRTQRVALP